MNMNQIKLPIPTRAPKLVAPKSAAPWDMLKALSEIEHEGYLALVKEPAVSAGLTPLPEIPGLGSLASMFAGPLQGISGIKPFGFGGGSSNPPRERVTGAEKEVVVDKGRTIQGRVQIV